MEAPFSRIVADVVDYYSAKVREHGPTARGVDWTSTESQELRFAQLLKVCDPVGSFSINDYGCGYGALLDYLARHGYRFQYWGFDAADPMVQQARELYAHRGGVTFTTDETALQVADYTVASGIFNVRLTTPTEQWRRYLLSILDMMDRLSRRGFAFNALTLYADADRMREDLYYADPVALFDHCKRRYSRRVALLHDYPLYEFTILVRK